MMLYNWFKSLISKSESTYPGVESLRMFLQISLIVIRNWVLMHSTHTNPGWPVRKHPTSMAGRQMKNAIAEKIMPIIHWISVQNNMASAVFPSVWNINIWIFQCQKQKKVVVWAIRYTRHWPQFEESYHCNKNNTLHLCPFWKPHLFLGDDKHFNETIETADGPTLDFTLVIRHKRTIPKSDINEM